ncbi:MAG: GEVED domain-containing protein [Bacteroidetes bacterium]|nr:GEVED domain-containing protein [Bacteroidota bacterium]
MRKLTLLSSLTLAIMFMASVVLGQNQARNNHSWGNAAMETAHSDALSAGLAPAGSPVVYTPLKPGAKLPTDVAYAYNAYAGTGTTAVGPFHFVLNNISVPTSIATWTGTDFIDGGTWKDGVWYGTVYNSTGGSTFISINTTTGARTVIGNMAGIIFTDIAYDWTSEVMYGTGIVSSQTKLYTINIATGTPTLVGTIGTFTGICLACDENGVLYTVNVGGNTLYSINKLTGAGTLIGPIGFNAAYAQTMEFDNSDNTLYFAAYDTTAGGQFRTVDRTTGATTLLGSWPGGMEVTGLAIQNGPLTVLDHDVKIQALVSPVTGPFLTATTPVTVTIKNVGANPESNFPISYVLNGGAPVTENFTATLASNAAANFTFTQTVDMSTPGTTYDLTVYTGLTGDQNTANDTIIMAIQNTFGIYCPASTDTCDEYISNVTLLTLNNTSTCTAGGYADYSATTVAMTVGQTATITVTNGNPYSGDYLAIWIDWNGDFNFLDDEPVIVTGGPTTFTATVAVPGYAFIGDVRMRLRLDYSAVLSPCGNTQYGEVEDYTISISGTQVMDDIGVVALVSPVSGVALPANAPVKVKVKNYGVNPQSNISVTYIFNNGTPVTETIAGPLTSGVSVVHTFAGTVNVSALGPYTFSVYTTLAADQNNANDTLNTVVECFPSGAVIYDNGTMVNSPGTGAGGADESILQGSLGMTSYGAGHALSSGYRVADDFTIPGWTTWNITGVSFYAYQTGSGTTTSINHVNFRIWNGLPGTGTLVYGDNTTNKLTSSVFSSIYRIQEGATGNTDRPVMKDDCNFSTLTLGPGTYWIDWQTGGTGASGPWVPPITINGQTTTGNAKQYNGTAWAALTDGGSLTNQGLPFKFYGSIIVGVDNHKTDSHINIFPNPATDVINVSSSYYEIKKVTVYTYVGQKVYENQVGDKTTEINTSGFRTGLYFVVVETENGTSTQKVTVE